MEINKIIFRDKRDFLSKLHQLIYDNSNALISIGVDKECRKFIKELKKLDIHYE